MFIYSSFYLFPQKNKVNKNGYDKLTNRKLEI